MVPILLAEPLLHGVFHLRPVFVRVSTLSTDYFEKVVLAVAHIMFDSVPLRVRQVLLYLFEPRGS